MERPEEGDHAYAARVVASELDRALHRLGPGVAEAHPRRSTAERGHRGQALTQLAVHGQVEVARAVVEERPGLVLDGPHDRGMAMPGGVHGDAGVEVEEPVAVDVFDD